MSKVVRCFDPLGNPIHDGDRVYDGYDSDIVVVPWNRNFDIGCSDVTSLSIVYSKNGETRRSHISSSAVYVNEVDAIANRVKGTERDNKQLQQQLEQGIQELKELKLRLAELRGEVIVLKPINGET